MHTLLQIISSYRIIELLILIWAFMFVHYTSKPDIITKITSVLLLIIVILSVLLTNIQQIKQFDTTINAVTAILLIVILTILYKYNPHLMRTMQLSVFTRIIIIYAMASIETDLFKICRSIGIEENSLIYKLLNIIFSYKTIRLLLFIWIFTIAKQIFNVYNIITILSLGLFIAIASFILNCIFTCIEHYIKNNKHIKQFIALINSIDKINHIIIFVTLILLVIM